MKRVIVGLLLGAFCCALLATPSTPLGRDPRLPSTTIYENKDVKPRTDDGGWEQPGTKSSAAAGFRFAVGHFAGTHLGIFIDCGIRSILGRIITIFRAGGTDECKIFHYRSIDADREVTGQ